jgi:nucleoside-diphosphate-sugar epimerase
MAKILVTGGAGFIGSSIAESLLAQGETVRILDDFSSGRRENLEGLKGRFDLLEGSIADPNVVKRAVEGVEVIFHEAAIPSVVRSVEEPAASVLVNIQGTTLLLEAAQRTRVRRVVFAASCAAYGDGPESPKVESLASRPLSAYAVSKLAGEQLMRVFASLYPIESISLRYFNIYGPRQDPKSQYAAVIPNFITAALKGVAPTVYGDGEQTRDFCFIDDVVAANLLAATSPKRLTGDVVNIARGERVSLKALLKHIGEEVGGNIAPHFEPARQGDIRDSLADISAAKALLGFEPRFSIRDGLKRTIAAYRAFTR